MGTKNKINCQTVPVQPMNVSNCPFSLRLVIHNPYRINRVHMNYTQSFLFC